MVINPIVGVYIPIIRIHIKGGMTIPNIATFDHGTYSMYFLHPKGKKISCISSVELLPQVSSADRWYLRWKLSNCWEMSPTTKSLGTRAPEFFAKEHSYVSGFGPSRFEVNLCLKHQRLKQKCLKIQRPSGAFSDMICWKKTVGQKTGPQPKGW